MQLVPNEVKQVIITERGKTCNWWQTKENKWSLLSAGKHATGAKRGETSNHYWARENMQLVPNEGKQVIIAECGENK